MHLLIHYALNINSWHRLPCLGQLLNGCFYSWRLRSNFNFHKVIKLNLSVQGDCCVQALLLVSSPRPTLLTLTARLVFRRSGRACASWEESGSGWMGRSWKTRGSCQTVRPRGNTVVPCPETRRTTGSPGTARSYGTSSAIKRNTISDHSDHMGYYSSGGEPFNATLSMCVSRFTNGALSITEWSKFYRRCYFCFNGNVFWNRRIDMEIVYFLVYLAKDWEIIRGVRTSFDINPKQMFFSSSKGMCIFLTLIMTQLECKVIFHTAKGLV